MTEKIVLEDLRLAYGDEVTEKITEDIYYCRKYKIDYNIEIVDDRDSNFVKIYFSTYAYAEIYEITMNDLRLYNHMHINYAECEKAMEMMDRLAEKRFGPIWKAKDCM